jgi:VanZ family protein
VLFSLFRAVGWTCVVAIVMLSLVPGNERPYTGLPGQIDHVIAYCGTAGLLGLGYPTTKVRFEIVAMLALLAAVLEVAQLWVPGRHSQFIDFAMSSGGACLGLSVVAIVDRITYPCGIDAMAKHARQILNDLTAP